MTRTHDRRTMNGQALGTALLAVLFAEAGCSSTPDDTRPAPTPTPAAAAPTTSATSTTPPSTNASPTSSAGEDPAPGSAPSAEPPASPGPGTVVRFTSGGNTVDVTIGADNPTTRDFLSMLPLTLTVEEFNGREKISYLPRNLDTNGSPGSDPADGDLIYYAPWGNLGFYYDTDGIGYSDDVVHLGTYDATLEQLTGLEDANVTIEIVQ
jgi:hypothetical protein